MIIQDTIDVLSSHLTELQTNGYEYHSWELTNALEFAIKILREKQNLQEKELEYEKYNF